MAVQLRRDEQVEVARKPSDPRMDFADVVEGARSAGLTAALCLVPAAVVLALGLRLLKPALLAAEKLRGDMTGDFWQESFMPGVLFVIFGAVFGGLVGWQIHARASLPPVLSWLIGGTATLLLAVAGIIAAAMIFTAGIPGTCWINLAFMSIAALVAFQFT